jgi:response regulator RpfG family c-di-GMP phosphodiesterase
VNTNPPSILSIDDDPLILKVLEDLVTRSGYQSVTTTNSDEALRYALDRKFAVVIADHNMPDMLGADLLHRFAQIQPSSSRILITGIKSLDVVTAAVNSGEIFRFVTKPWISAEMMATLHNAVQRHELIETNRSLERTTLDLNQKLSEANTRLEKQLRELEAGKRELDFSHEALKTNFSRSLELCQRILTTFNPLLGEQAKAALKIAQIMAETHYFDEEQKHVLEVSARLYDIGLAAIPSGFMMAVQNDLEDSPPEMKTIFQNHTIHGQTLASFVDLLKPVGDTIRAHHERFDGKGFPDGLAGEMIPWPARCLAVVVYYVTCGLPHEQAVDRILEQSGSAFDPDATRLFLRCAQATPLPRLVREVMVDELDVGMQLASGIYSPTGVLLVAEGYHLDENTIKKIRNYNSSSSLLRQLLVYC